MVHEWLFEIFILSLGRSPNDLSEVITSTTATLKPNLVQIRPWELLG